MIVILNTIIGNGVFFLLPARVIGSMIANKVLPGVGLITRQVFLCLWLGAERVNCHALGVIPWKSFKQGFLEDLAVCLLPLCLLLSSTKLMKEM
jgi:hypothetical protein